MWYKIQNEAAIYTPAVLVYPDRIEENIRRMIRIAGDASRLRPHVKTHKIAEIVRMQVQLGITRFKCATLTEVNMVAGNGGKDILLAYPLFGPGIAAFFDLRQHYPKVDFSVTIDSESGAKVLMQEAEKRKQPIDVFVDLDNGMHRTGIDPAVTAGFVESVDANAWLNFRGFHVYDGHIHEPDIDKRREQCVTGFESVNRLVAVLNSKGIKTGELACGGTFTFPIHAIYPNRTLCPGTTVLWDAGYEKNIPDLDFLCAALLVGRVISKPNLCHCFDLGHKAMAAEMSQPRVHFPKLEKWKVISQSEEHLVISTSGYNDLPEGEMVYAIPVHICPTMALHEKVYVVRNGLVTGTWDVVARKRTY